MQMCEPHSTVVSAKKNKHFTKCMTYTATTKEAVPMMMNIKIYYVALIMDTYLGRSWISHSIM